MKHFTINVYYGPDRDSWFDRREEMNREYLPYNNGVRRDYNSLRTDWEALTKIEATQADKEALLKDFSKAIQAEMGESRGVNVYTDLDIQNLLEMAGLQSETTRIITEKQDYIQKNNISADKYKGKLYFRDGKLSIEHQTKGLFNLETNINISFSLNKDQIAKNIKAEQEARAKEAEKQAIVAEAKQQSQAEISALQSQITALQDQIKAQQEDLAKITEEQKSQASQSVREKDEEATPAPMETNEDNPTPPEEDTTGETTDIAKQSASDTPDEADEENQNTGDEQPEEQEDEKPEEKPTEEINEKDLEVIFDLLPLPYYKSKIEQYAKNGHNLDLQTASRSLIKQQALAMSTKMREMAEIQKTVGIAEKEITGSFGPKTEIAIHAYNLGVQATEKTPIDVDDKRSEDEIKNIQENILKFTGTDADGKMGPKTQTAINAYNKAINTADPKIIETPNTPSAEEIEQVKTLQKQLGFTEAEVDGVIGIRTVATALGAGLKR